jgi:SAM-dependent methyltransferase
VTKNTEINNKSEWFEKWFDSPYYHLLYKDRDHKEAEFFIDNLVLYLNPSSSSHFLDLCCGKGRHSIYLNKKGFEVTGVDLAPQSIAHAKKSESHNLRFFVHDKRHLFRENYFDVVVNLFTSFGYFEKEEDDMAAIHMVWKALKPGGIFVLDFLNSVKVINHLKEKEVKTIGDITFNISKKLENNFIVKQIEFADKGIDYHFEERVKALKLDDFEKYFKANNLKILHLSGNYQLDAFNGDHSDRLIIIAQREKV